MLKKCKVVMLPTNEKAPLMIESNKLYFATEYGFAEFDHRKNFAHINKQHLYILSNEEIKEGDWGFDLEKSEIMKVGNTFIVEELWKKGILKKIIATTDTSLTTNFIFGINSFDSGIFGGKSEIIKLPNLFKLPQPSQSFIQKYIEKYNKGEQITEVMVEYYDYVKEDEDWDDNIGAIPHDIHICKPKINPKDNTITIKPVKDSWNREEVKDLILNAYQRGYEDRDFDLGYGSNKPFCLEQMD